MKNAKFYLAALTAVLNGVVALLPVDSTAARAVQFALTLLGAVAVYLVPNAAGQGRSE